MLSLTMHLQSVILQYRYRYHIIAKSCRPIGLTNQIFVRHVAFCMHSYLAKPLISTYALTPRVYQALQATVPHTSYTG